MSRHRLVLTIVAAVAVLACPLLAGPLQREQVSAKAKWVLHADVKGFLASKTGAFVLEEMKKKGVEAVLSNIQEAFGFDVTKDLKGLTLYGSRFGDHPAIVLIHATMDRNRLTQILQGNPTYREMKYGGHTVHQWTDNPEAEKPGATRFGVFHADDLAVVTEDLQLLQLAVDVLDKKADSLAARKAPKPLPSAGDKPFLTALVRELPPIGAGKPEGVILGKIASGRLEAAETGNKLRVQVALTGKTAATATNLRKVAEGLLALIDLATPEEAARAGDPLLFQGKAIPAELLAVLKDVTVGAQDRTVTIDADVPVENAIALLRRIIHQKKDAGAEPAPAEK
jgi:hypothetical protein